MGYIFFHLSQNWCFRGLLGVAIVISAAKATPSQAQSGSPSAQIMVDSLGAQLQEVAAELFRDQDLELATLRIARLKNWIQKPEITRDFRTPLDLELHAKMRRDLHIWSELVTFISQLTPEGLEEMLVKRRYDRAQIKDLYSAIRRGEAVDVPIDENILRKKAWIDQESDKDRIRDVRWEVTEQLLSQIGNLMRGDWLYAETYEVMSWTLNLTMETLLEAFPPTVVHLAINHQMIEVLTQAYQSVAVRGNIGPETQRMLQNLSSVELRHPFLQLQARALLKRAHQLKHSIAPSAQDLTLYKKSLQALVFRVDPQNPQVVAPYYFIPSRYMYTSESVPVGQILLKIENWLVHHGFETEKWSLGLGTSAEGVETYQNMQLNGSGWPCFRLLSPVN